MEAVAYLKGKQNSEQKLKQLMRLAENERLEIVKIFNEAEALESKGSMTIEDLLQYIKRHKQSTIIISSLTGDVTEEMYIVSQNDDEVSVRVVNNVYLSKKMKVNVLEKILTACIEPDRENVTKRLISGQRKKVINQGKRATGTVSYGYRYVYDDKTRKNIGAEIDEMQANIVREIFKEYANGTGLQQIANDLNSKNIKNSRGNDWTKQGINYLLKNDFYIGYVRNNDLKVRGQHEPIITKEVWNKVQSRLGSSRKNRN